MNRKLPVLIIGAALVSGLAASAAVYSIQGSKVKDANSSLTTTPTTSNSTSSSGGFVAKSKPVSGALPYAGITYAVTRNVLSDANWQQEWLHTGDCTGNCSIAFDNRVSVVLLRFKWAQINSTPGVYDFTSLIEMLKQLKAMDKKASIGVMAGIYTPSWLFNAPYNALYRSIDAPSVSAEAFSQRHVPAPWDPAYQKAYNDVFVNMAAAIKAAGLSDTVALVKNSVISSHSDETRLEDSDKDDSKESSPEECLAWEKIGYTEDKILATFANTSDVITRAFPGVAIGLNMVTGSNRFPNVGHCTDAKANNKTLDTIVKNFVTTYKDRAVVNSTVLSYDSGIPKSFAWIRENGGHIGFQLNRQKVGCSATPGTAEAAACSSPEYIANLKEAIQDGIDAGADFIEVHDGNMHRNKDILPEYDYILRQNSAR
jgi:hypothetical protein